MSDVQAGNGHVGDDSIAAQAQDKVQQTAQKASQKSAEYVRSQTEARAAQVSEELRSVAQALRRSGHSLHADGNTVSGGALDSVTDAIERVAAYLGESDGAKMLEDVETFGRRKPWGLVGIGVGVGIAASRFLKASSHTRYQAAQQPRGMMTPRQGLPAPSAPVTAVGRTATPVE